MEFRSFDLFGPMMRTAASDGFYSPVSSAEVTNGGAVSSLPECLHSVVVNELRINKTFQSKVGSKYRQYIYI
jgi:hypothetical protein